MLATTIGHLLRFGCLFLLAAIPAWGDEPAGRGDVAAEFRRDALLRRFDLDLDGELNPAELEKLRDAYAGVSVPVLPATRYSYLQPLPAHLDPAQLAETDNTPDTNPLTDAGVELGRVLFYDRQLSRNDTISCASCHLQERGFADPRQFSLGFAGGRTGRNAMSLANLRYSILQGSRPGFFWDERAATLEDQVLMPIQDQVEMGMDLAELERKLAGLAYYPPLFEAAFGSPDVTRERIARAVAQFLRGLVSFDAKFDRAAREAEDLEADFAGFTAEENLGKSLFINGVAGVGEFGCAHCHIPPTFGMPRSFNNGLELHYQDQGLGALKRPTNDPFTPSNDGKFKAPSLRNVALTAPFMHDGRFQSLEQVVQHYSNGVHPHENLGLVFENDEPEQTTGGFRMSAEQQRALVAFLKTLTDDTFVTDPRFSDPFPR